MGSAEGGRETDTATPKSLYTAVTGSDGTSTFMDTNRPAGSVLAENGTTAPSRPGLTGPQCATLVRSTVPVKDPDTVLTAATSAWIPVGSWLALMPNDPGLWIREVSTWYQVDPSIPGSGEPEIRVKY